MEKNNHGKGSEECSSADKIFKRTAEKVSLPKRRTGKEMNTSRDRALGLPQDRRRQAREAAMPDTFRDD